MGLTLAAGRASWSQQGAHPCSMRHAVNPESVCRATTASPLFTTRTAHWWSTKSRKRRATTLPADSCFPREGQQRCGQNGERVMISARVAFFRGWIGRSGKTVLRCRARCSRLCGAVNTCRGRGRSQVLPVTGRIRAAVVPQSGTSGPPVGRKERGPLPSAAVGGLLWDESRVVFVPCRRRGGIFPLPSDAGYGGLVGTPLLSGSGIFSELALSRRLQCQPLWLLLFCYASSRCFVLFFGCLW